MANLKKEMVKTTYSLLKTEGIESMKIRRIAAEVGCSSTAIYKHFDDIDHLVSFASVMFLKDYFNEFHEIFSYADMNPLDINYLLWERFSDYAFRDVEIFELLFFGKYKEQLGDMVYEYYQLFQHELTNFDGLSASILFSNDLREREYIMQRRAASTGYLLDVDIALLSDLVVYTFHGALLKYKETYKDPEMAEEGATRFMDIYRMVMIKYRIR